MKKKLLLLFILFLTVTCVKTENKLVLLNGPWFFQIDRVQEGIEQQWFLADHDLAAVKRLIATGFWDSLAGAEYDGWGWYFTEFSYAGQFDKVALHFTSVDDNAIIWLNGKKVGAHQGANIEFKLDVTGIIKNGPNRLAILIEDLGGPGGLNGSVELFHFQDETDLLKGKYFDAKAPVHPKWSENAVIYELNTRQFSQAGTFKAIASRIQELKDLGVTIIWFMPIHPIGEVNRKGTLGSYYAVRDYYGINPEFGTLEDFRQLVQLIHKAGMYVLIDLVANHTARDNPLIEEHPTWYTKDEEGKVIPPVPDWTDVADLNYENRELWRYMIDVMKYWVKEVGIDGYRCDVAAMVPTEFWIQARKELDNIKPVFMLAEAETPELNAYGFDMTYAGAMHRLFNDIARGKASVKKIDDYYQYEHFNYPRGSMRMRFTSNHDENSWNQSTITRMGIGGAKVGAVLTFTLPGTPLIYNGQEVGNEKALEFFERDPIVWQESNFRAFYQALAKTYRDHPALYQGMMCKLVSDNNDQIYAFVRKTGNDEVVTIVNFTAETFHGDIDFKDVYGSFKDIFRAETITFNGMKIKFNMQPWEYRVYVVKVENIIR